MNENAMLAQLVQFDVIYFILRIIWSNLASFFRSTVPPLFLIYNINWGEVYYKLASLGVLALLFFNLWQMRKYRKDRNFSIFLKMADNYDKVSEKRRSNWLKLKDAVKKNAKISHEISDKTSSIDYLLLRINQAEPFYGIEHLVIKYEIESLNLLNEMCRYAARDEAATTITQIMFASEISFYKNKYNSLIKLQQHEKEILLLPIPRYDALIKFPILGFFEEINEPNE